MARFKRRRNVGRPAGPFATAVKGGRARSWESLAAQYVYDEWSDNWPVTGIVLGADLVNFRVLTPINVTRGVVTLQRIRGTMGLAWNVPGIAGSGGRGFATAAFNIQLMPARGGVILDSSVLDPTNAADQESNRILWRQTALLDPGSDETGILLNGDRFFLNTYDIDVKVSRRYDVSEWALVMAIKYDAAEIANNLAMLEMRALYLATDGV